VHHEMSWETSLYAKITSSTSCLRMRPSSMLSGDYGDTLGVLGAGKLGGVAATVDVRDLRCGEGRRPRTSGSSRKTTLKLWKSRPAAPMMTTRFSAPPPPSYGPLLPHLFHRVYLNHSKNGRGSFRWEGAPR